MTCASSTGGWTRPFPIGDAGGTLHVELNHTDPEVLPAGFRTDSNDSRILACALNLAAERRATVRRRRAGHQDMPLRVKAAAVGLTADEYHALDVVPSGWTGMADLAVTSSDIDDLFREGVIDLDAARELPCHTGLRLHPARGSAALGRVTADKRVRMVRGDREAFGLHGRSAEQRVALDLLLGPGDRHRLPRRPGGHGQVGAGAVRRAGGGDGAPAAPQGRGVPAAVRRRRAGAGLPAGQREREDGALGAGRVRHPRRAGQPGRASRRSSPAACWRCSRSPTSAAGRCTTPS